MSAEIVELTAAQAAERVRAGDLSAGELFDAYRERAAWERGIPLASAVHKPQGPAENRSGEATLGAHLAHARRRILGRWRASTGRAKGEVALCGSKLAKCNRDTGASRRMTDRRRI